MKRVWIRTCLVIFAALAFSACGGGEKKVTLDVEMNDQFKFIPDSYSVPAGAEVTLNLSNVGALEHEFVLFKLGIQASPPVDETFIDANRVFEGEVEAGQKMTFTFTAPDQPGNYQVVCAIPGHFEAGMVATLTVTQ